MENETTATVAEVIRAMVRRGRVSASQIESLLNVPEKDALEAARCIADCNLDREEAIEYLCEMYCDCVIAGQKVRMI